MPRESVPPLNNPPSQRDDLITIPNKDNQVNSSYGSNGRGRGVSKGGKERVKPAEAILKCSMCGRMNKVVFPVGRPPQYHKCIWCNQVQPADGFRVIMYGLGLPQVLAPHELELRKQASQVDHPQW